MDLIPLITDIVFYFLGALVLVLIISYSFSRMMGNRNDIETDSLMEKRKHIRQYIIHQNKYITSTASGGRRSLAMRNYSPPAYSTDLISRKSTNVNKIVSTKEINSTSTSADKKSKENFKRYSIVNDAATQNSERLHLDPRTNSYLAIKEQHYYRS